MTILDTIVEEKHRELLSLPARAISPGDLKKALAARGDRRDFGAGLRRPRNGWVGLISEVKKASPSAGIICHDFDPVRIAQAYERAGADCLSVLTDEKFFQGSLDFLRQIRSAVSLPLLRKDFIIDERQVLQSIEAGADAILLIVAILDERQLKTLYSLATGAGLAVLVEVHDELELQRALSLTPELLGINNRNLNNFKVDLATTERLASRVQSFQKTGTAASLLVSESGIHQRSDVDRLVNCGAGAILVGESLMRGGDISAKVRELVGAPPA